MTCPDCHTTADPLLQIGDVAICAACGASLHIGADGVRKMRHSDTETMDLAEMAQLRRARASIVRADRTRI